MAEAIVAYDYDAVQEDELTLKVGQVIMNIKVMEDGWWEGELNGRKGLFPDNFVELKCDKPVRAKAPSPTLPTSPPVNGEPSQLTPDIVRRGSADRPKKLRAKVVYSYCAVNNDEIALQINDIVEVTGQPEEGWWEGLVKGRKGMFPSNFVSVLEDGEQGDKTDAPPVMKEEPPPLPAEPPKPKSHMKAGLGFGNIFAGGEVKLKKTGGSGGGASTPEQPKKDLPAKGPSELAQKRLSLKRAVPIGDFENKDKVDEAPKKETGRMDVKKSPPSSKKLGNDENEEIIREKAKATYPYEAQHSDELELKEGDIVTILDKQAGDSGWWLGEVDGRTGVFPDNFVVMLPPEKEKVKKVRAPAPMPARPVPRNETKSTSSRPLSTKQPSLDGPVKPPTQPPPIPVTNQEPVKAPPTVEPVNRKSAQPTAAPKPVFPKKPPVKIKPIPAKPSAAPVTSSTPAPAITPDRDEGEPVVVLRNRQPVQPPDKDGAFDDLKTDAQKLTHITLSRPKNANRRPPSVFGGVGGGINDALPGENGPSIPPPRPKSSPIGMMQVPVVVTQVPAQAHKSPIATSRPRSIVSDVSGSTNTQLEELKKDVKTVQEQMAAMRSEFKKEIVKLMTELDEEKKQRMAMQVELDRVKKIVFEKD